MKCFTQIVKKQGFIYFFICLWAFIPNAHGGNICDRTLAVQKEIMKELGVKKCQHRRINERVPCVDL